MKGATRGSVVEGRRRSAHRWRGRTGWQGRRWADGEEQGGGGRGGPPAKNRVTEEEVGRRPPGRKGTRWRSKGGRRRPSVFSREGEGEVAIQRKTEREALNCLQARVDGANVLWHWVLIPAANA